MPTSEELEQRAHDYGFYTSKIAEMKIEETALKASLAELQGQEEARKGEIASHEEAVTKLHQEVLDLEQKITQLKKDQDEAKKVDRAIADQQHKANAEEVARLDTLSKEMDRRKESLDTRERTLKEEQARVETRERVTIDKIGESERKLAESQDIFQKANIIKRENETKMIEMNTILRKTQDAEASAKSAQEQARLDRLSSEETAGKAKNDMYDMQHSAEKNAAIVAEMKNLVPVLTDLRKFIMENVKNPDAIFAYVEQHFPLGIHGLNQG